MKRTHIAYIILLVGVSFARPAHAQYNCSYYVDGLDPGKQFGHKLAFTGDVNLDGRPEIVVGTWYPGDLVYGWAHVVTGRTSTILYSNTFSNLWGWELFGSAVGGGLDLNGDSYPDYVVASVVGDGCKLLLYDAGALHMYSGQSGHVFPDCVMGYFGGQEFASSVDVIPDISGDGLADVLIGAQSTPGGGTDRGRVYAYTPALDGTNSDPLAGTFREYTGLHDYDAVGWSVAALGDVNGDGVPDLVSGAPSDWNHPPEDTGRVYVFSGAASETILWTAAASTNGTLFGYDVANAGDLDSDGIDDVIVGEQWSNIAGSKSGRIWAYSGATGAYLWDAAGPQPGINMGISVISAGDLNGDLVPDVAAGAPWWGGKGRVYIFSGLNGSYLADVTGDANNEAFGYDVASGDIDNDGKPDLFVGAKDYSAGLGRVYIFRTTDCCGISVTGDVNLDGVLTAADIILIVDYVFKSGPVPDPCEAAADVNCDGVVTSADIIYLVNHVFKSGPLPCNVCSLVPDTWFCP